MILQKKFRIVRGKAEWAGSEQTNFYGKNISNRMDRRNLESLAWMHEGFAGV